MVRVFFAKFLRTLGGPDIRNRLQSPSGKNLEMQDLDPARPLWMSTRMIREWVYESSQCDFAMGHELDVSRVALNFVRQRNGNHARGWWSQFQQQKRIEDGDRANFDALPLIEMIQVTAEFDQLHAAADTSFKERGGLGLLR